MDRVVGTLVPMSNFGVVGLSLCISASCSSWYSQLSGRSDGVAAPLGGPAFMFSLLQASKPRQEQGAASFHPGGTASGGGRGGKMSPRRACDTFFQPQGRGRYGVFGGKKLGTYAEENLIREIGGQ